MNSSAGFYVMGKKRMRIDVSNLAKYFEHGIIFSLVMCGYLLFLPLVEWIVRYPVVPMTFEPMAVLFTIVYIFIGLFIVLGAINSSVSESLWQIGTSEGWQSLLGNGVILFIVLCIVQVPAAIVTTLLAWMQPGGLFFGFWNALPAIIVPSIVITPIPNGVVAKRLALMTSSTTRPETMQM